MKRTISKNVLYGIIGVLLPFIQLNVLHAQVSSFQTEKGVPVFPMFDAAPASAILGMIYINSSDKKFYWYNGSTWLELFGTLLSGKPSLDNLVINGNFYLGGTVAGTYTYKADEANAADESNSVYTWYYATDDKGTGKTAIPGKTGTTTQATAGTATSYTIASPVSVNYIALGIKPHSLPGANGSEVLSNWVQVLNIIPSYTSASIGNQTSGYAENGTTITAVTGTYSTTPATTGSEGTPVYQWYWATDATGTGKTAISGQTSSSHTVDAGNTSFGYNNYSYLAVGITPKTISGISGSEVLSTWVPVWKCGLGYIVAHTTSDGFSPINATITYETVLSDGNCWLGRNLGATTQSTAYSVTSAGWYFQWNYKQGYYWNGSSTVPTWADNNPNNVPTWASSNDPCKVLGTSWSLPTEAQLSVLKGHLTGSTASDVSSNSGINDPKMYIPLAGYFNNSTLILPTEQSDIWTTTNAWQIYSVYNQFYTYYVNDKSFPVRCVHP